MIGVVGDLITDVVVHFENAEDMGDDFAGNFQVRYGTDTNAEITQRRGGSAATLAVVVASQLAADVAFFGNVGDDVVGDNLLRELEDAGVRANVTRSGRTGSVVALLDASGERSMLTDRAAAKDFTNCSAEWLSDISLLHIPAYSLVVEPLGSTVMEMASQVGRVSISVSSVGAVEDFGLEKFWDLVKRLEPALLVCNKAEAELLGEERLGVFETIVTAGANPTQIFSHSGEDGFVAQKTEIAPQDLGRVKDTTGAGDAFTAGLLVGLDVAAMDVADSAKFGKEKLEQAVKLGHKAAAELLKSRQ